MALDPYTQLRQMGYAGTLDEMLAKYYNDITGLDTIGEQLYKALSQAMALNVLGITATGSSTVAVPSGLAATGVPSPTTFLAGDGAWRTPAGGGGGGGSGTDPNAAHPANNEQITGVWTYTTQPVGINKASVGLGNVNNTSDTDKPVSTASDAKYATKVNVAHTGTTSFDPGSISQAAIAGLVEALASAIQLVASTVDVEVNLMYELVTSNTAAVRPSLPSTAVGYWIAPTAPTNMALGDKWAVTT